MMDMNFRDFTEYCKQKMGEYPEKKDQIFDMFELCFSEIEDEGSSETHEVELAISSIKEIVNE